MNDLRDVAGVSASVGQKVVPKSFPITGKSTVWESQLKDRGYNDLDAHLRTGEIIEIYSDGSMKVLFSSCNLSCLVYSDEIFLAPTPTTTHTKGDAEFNPPDFEEIAARPPRNSTRALYRHIAPGMPHGLLVQVNDPVTAGGANYSYEIVLPDGTPFPFEFQSQEPELGVNGVTMEALLAICIDRLECFQKGPYPCRENALALTKIEEALLWLHRRTERLALDE